MSRKNVIKTKLGSEAYSAWRSAQVNESGEDYLSTELLRAEPDLLPSPEVKENEYLDVAIEVIQNGGLQELTPIQQRIFQLSIVEGMRNTTVAKVLRMDESTVREHLKYIGNKLRRLCEERM